MNSVGTAYVLWLGMLLGVSGLHRLYNGKIVSGLLWMFTLGLFGFGQFIDLFLIPGMVEDHNLKLRVRRGLLVPANEPTQPVIERVVVREAAPAPEVTAQKLTIQLLKAAAARGGRLTVTQGVLATEAGFAEVETALKELVRSGYVDVCNDPDSGVVTYDFREL